MNKVGELEVELRKQKEELEEEIGPIIKLSNEGKLSYEQYLEKIIEAIERAKEKYKERKYKERHGVTNLPDPVEYDREDDYIYKDLTTLYLTTLLKRSG